MSYFQIMTLVAYGSLALFALWRVWGMAGVRQVGFAIVAAFAASNTVAYSLEPVHWPAFFSVIDTIFALVCAKAGKDTDSKVPIPLISLSVIAICANTAFSFTLTRDLHQVNLWLIVLNIVFTAQCLVIGFWGPADEFLRTGRVPWRSRGSGNITEPARHQASDEAR